MATLDLSVDALAEAPLTPEQREAWNRARAELKAARERIRDLEKDSSAHAVLTRPEFNREVARMLALDERYGSVSSVLYFDIDNIEAINARRGPSATDALVRKICDTLTTNCRSSDIVGRLGGDEFGVLLAHCDNPAAWKKGESLANLLQEALAQTPDLEPKPAISLGAYTFSENEDVATGLKQAAEAVTRGENKKN